MKSNSVLRLSIELVIIAALVVAVRAIAPTRETESVKRPASTARAPVAKVEAPRIRKRAALEVYKPELAFPGYTLLAVSGSESVRLLNMQGAVVNTWPVDVQRARLLPNCNLLVVHGSKWGIKQAKWQKQRKFVREYDWHDKLVWEYAAKSKAHHDIHRLENGNTLFLRFNRVPRKFPGRKEVLDPIRRVGRIMSDSIVEISPAGELVWQWNFYDNFDLNQCGPGPCPPYLAPTDDPKRVKFDWSHMNTAAPLPENRWYRAGHKDFKPGNLVILPRNWSTVFIVDRDSGKPVWEYSGPKNDRIKGGHEANMIPESLPGAGNILIFDNGNPPGKLLRNGKSRILEVNPINEEIVWSYRPGLSFFSKAAGAAQRLPNGNTLISEDLPARILEITPSREIVWQYQAEGRTSRAKRYGVNYCPQLAELS